MTWRNGALVASLAVASIGAWSAVAVADEAGGPVLVERPACAAPTPLPQLDGTRTDGDTAVSFQVPATTWLRVVDGELQAATNTGCAPRATDQVVGGTAAQALAFRSGDWTSPGTWHTLD